MSKDSCDFGVKCYFNTVLTYRTISHVWITAAVSEFLSPPADNNLSEPSCSLRSPIIQAKMIATPAEAMW